VISREKGNALATKGKRERLLPQKGKGKASRHKREKGKPGA